MAGYGLHADNEHPDSTKWDLAAILQDAHHRMANSLTTLGAILRREFADSCSGPFDIRLRHCLQHITAVAELNRHLSGGWDTTEQDVEAYFEPFCTLLARSTLEPRRIRCEVFIGPGTLRMDKCGYLALIIGELVTNAAKHAFAGCEAGCVRIQIVPCQDTWYCLVADNGGGIEGHRHGTGTTIVDKLVAALDGQLHVSSGTRGTKIAIAFRD